MFQRVAANVEQYMNVLSARQKLVVSNIANVDTPNFKTKDLDFRAELNAAVTGSPSSVLEVSNLPSKNDGNNVNLDRESRMLAENAMRFNLATSLAREEIKNIRSAIQDGK